MQLVNVLTLEVDKKMINQFYHLQLVIFYSSNLSFSSLYCFSCLKAPK